ncbi:branched-chain amino acid ABC transporter permease [Candidatus Acetothermia bacterium]|nr:branched-chain amino acid ABC transporter permease [Candidatus Acetothermia bacterium]MBI3643918.1 branched-chain amino acid ABC transporter permease [Candidatus Acetothermia bacterium]
MEQLLGQFSFALLNGFVWGWILALLALGLSLIYANLKWLNLAHGAFYMLGGMLVWKLQDSLGFWLALPISVLAAGAFGVISEWLIFRPIHDPKRLLLAAIGLMLALQELAAIAFGRTPQSVINPLPGAIGFLDKQFPVYWLVVAASAALVLTALWIFLRRTRPGLWMRAVGQERELALSLGIPVPLVYTATFGLGTALAALAGGLIAPIIGVHPYMGLEILVLALVVVIIGRSPWGSVGIALLISELENLLPVVTQALTGEAISPTLARVSILTLLLGILLVRARNPETSQS